MSTRATSRRLVAAALGVLTAATMASPALAAGPSTPRPDGGAVTPKVTNCADYVDENVTEAVFDTVEGRDCVTLLARSVDTVAELHGVAVPARLAAVSDATTKQVQEKMAQRPVRFTAAAAAGTDAAAVSVPDASSDAATRGAQLEAVRWVVRQMREHSAGRKAATQVDAAAAGGPLVTPANGVTAGGSYLDLHFIDPITVVAAPIRDAANNIFAFNLTARIVNSLGRFDYLMQGNASTATLRAQSLTYYSDPFDWSYSVQIASDGNIVFYKYFGNTFASQEIGLRFNPQGNIVSATARIQRSEYASWAGGFYTVEKFEAHWTSAGVVQAQGTVAGRTASLAVTGGWDLVQGVPMGSLSAAYRVLGMGNVSGSLGWSPESGVRGMVQFHIQF